MNRWLKWGLFAGLFALGIAAGSYLQADECVCGYTCNGEVPCSGLCGTCRLSNQSKFMTSSLDPTQCNNCCWRPGSPYTCSGTDGQGNYCSWSYRACYTLANPSCSCANGP
jgi:hypothetical protein